MGAILKIFTIVDKWNHLLQVASVWFFVSEFSIKFTTVLHDAVVYNLQKLVSFAYDLVHIRKQSQITSITKNIL